MPSIHVARKGCLVKVRNPVLIALVSSVLSLFLQPSPAWARKGKEASFRVGFLYPRTGRLAPYGQSLSEGVKLALSQFREENPKLGAEVSVIVADDGGLASLAEKAAERLITTQKAHVLIGSLSNIVNQSLSAVSTKNRTLLLLPRSTDEGQLGTSLTFTLSPTDRRQGRMMAAYTSRQLRRERAAIIFDTQSPDAEAIAKGFSEGFTQAGGTIVGQWSFDSRRPNIDRLFEEVAKAQPDIVVHPGSYRGLQALVEGARKYGLKGPWLGSDGWDHEALVTLNPSLGTHYFFSYFHPSDPQPGVQNFVYAYETTYGKKPDALAAAGFESMRVLLQAYALAKSSDTQALLKALEQARLAGMYSGRFSSDHVFLRPSPFLVTANQQIRFMSRVALDD
jgi:branched-chain amino acid transport system substrate-binding protein